MPPLLVQSEAIILDAISDRVAAVLGRSGCTQTEFARRINVSQSMVSLICKGRTGVSDRTISDICREFGVDERWLRTGEGEMKRKVPEGEALAAQLGELLRDVDADFKRRLISELLRLPPEAWAQIEAFARRITGAGDGKEEAGQ